MIACDDVHLTVHGRPLLAEVSLRVAPGRTLALVGPNGAGKSTLLSVLCGDRSPDLGHVELGDAPLRATPAHDRARRMTVLPQHPTAAPSLTPAEVVGLGLQLCWGQADPAIVDGALRRLGVSALAHTPMGRLSGGERQRVHLARVVAQADASAGAQAILLDEPTSAQDPGHLHVVLCAIRHLRKRHAVIAVLHDLHAASAVATHLCLMAGGRVVRTGTPDEVLHPDLLAQVYRTPFHTLSHPDLRRPLVLPNLSLEEA